MLRALVRGCRGSPAADSLGTTGARPAEAPSGPAGQPENGSPDARSTGSSAIVTGAASGLGAATAAALAGAGVQVVGIDLAAGWERAGARRPTSSPRRGTSPSPRTSRRPSTGGARGPLRIAVNCAGIGTAGRILSRKGVHDLDLFTRVIAVNLIGTFNVLRLAAAAIAATDPVDERGSAG